MDKSVHGAYSDKYNTGKCPLSMYHDLLSIHHELQDRHEYMYQSFDALKALCNKQEKELEELRNKNG